MYRLRLAAPRTASCFEIRHVGSHLRCWLEIMAWDATCRQNRETGRICRLRICRFELLQKSNHEEWQKDGRNQRKISLGQYLFVNPSLQIWHAEREGVTNGTS